MSPVMVGAVPDLGDLGTALADDAADQLVRHGDLVGLGAGTGALRRAQLRASQGRQRRHSCSRR